MSTNPKNSTASQDGGSENLSPAMAKMFNDAVEANQGFVEPDEPSENQEQPETKDVPEEKPDEPEAPEPNGDEDADDPSVSDETPEETEGDEPDDTPDETPDEDADVPTERPTRYIPVNKYQSEKKEWKAKNQELEAEIEKLRSVTPDSVEETDLVADLAEKYDMNEAQVRDLVDVIQKKTGLTDEDRAALQSFRQQQQQQILDAQDTEYFEKEFSSIALPALKKKYPNATEAQLNSAKNLLDEISHSEEYHKSKMEHILKLEDETIASVFGGPEAKRPATRTSETSRTTSHVEKPLSASDIKSPKDFGRLLAQPKEKRYEILSELNPVLYTEYLRYEGASEQGVTVNRGGRDLRL